LSVDAARHLLAYEWPGNVRELQNCMEHAVALTETERIEVRDLPESLREAGRSPDVARSAREERIETLEEGERRHILHVVEIVGGHRHTAARILGLDRKTLYRKLARYRMDESSRAS